MILLLTQKVLDSRERAIRRRFRCAPTGAPSWQARRAERNREGVVEAAALHQAWLASRDSCGVPDRWTILADQMAQAAREAEQKLWRELRELALQEHESQREQAPAPAQPVPVAVEQSSQVTPAPTPTPPPAAPEWQQYVPVRSRQLAARRRLRDAASGERGGGAE